MMSFCSTQEMELIRVLMECKTPLSSQGLAAMLGMGNRQLRAMISHLRADHQVPVCSTPRDGYFWPCSRSAADSTLAQLRARQRELQAAIDGIQDGLDKWLGYQYQMEMDPYGTPDPWCADCGIELATKWCSACGSHLCSACKREHRACEGGV